MPKTTLRLSTGILAVEDKSGQIDTWGASVMYTDGPLSVSLGHAVADRADGTERSATMFSAGYALAPGVSWKTSIFGVDDDHGRRGERRHGVRDRHHHRLLIRPLTGT